MSGTVRSRTVIHGTQEHARAWCPISSCPWGRQSQWIESSADEAQATAAAHALESGHMVTVEVCTTTWIKTADACRPCDRGCNPGLCGCGGNGCEECRSVPDADLDGEAESAGPAPCGPCADGNDRSVGCTCGRLPTDARSQP